MRGILPIVTFVVAGPSGFHAAILAGLEAGGDGHALGTLLDLPPDDFDMAGVSSRVLTKRANIARCSA
ncbi:hypothetical protein HGG72_17950 [Ochrobactrum pecoris]|uniref:Uncharacterized protein n=1 Tax=Brucella pecoris TaxID=867683 RepID=A0AB34Z0W7_9HYPH|nr:hypothetical protein [Brucella pecoris]MBB4096203.1 hypothetical protein [Brucella pecoris]NKW81767.1 hypothetical protein [Brucella pecoris]